MTAMTPEDITVLEDLEQYDPPCELGIGKASCDNPAKWVMFRAPGVCDCKSRPPALACETCKDWRVQSEGAVTCHDCLTVIAPARIAYSRIETL